MPDDLAPRSCVVCAADHGPAHVEGCWRCHAKVGHVHVTVTGRDGTSCTVAACGVHNPFATPRVGRGRKRPADGHTPVDRRELAAVRARERRAAARIVIQAHADEYQRVLAEVRG